MACAASCVTARFTVPYRVRARAARWETSIAGSHYGTLVARATSVQHVDVPGAHLTHEHHIWEDLRIHVVRGGQDTSKNLILFLHGWPEFWYSWREQLKAFSDDYEVAAVDLPGYNDSDKPVDQAAYLTGNVSKVLAALLKSLGRESCILVGHDWGSLVASDFAAIYPAKVSKLVLLAVPPTPLLFQPDLRQRLASAYVALFNIPWLAEQVLAWNDYAVVNRLFQSKGFGLKRRAMPDSEVQAYKDAIAVPGAATGGFSYYRALVRGQRKGANTTRDAAWKERPQLAMPVLLIVGDSDPAVLPNCMCKVGEVAPNSVIRVLPNCSHWVQIDATQDCNDVMREFLKNPVMK